MTDGLPKEKTLLYGVGTGLIVATMLYLAAAAYVALQGGLAAAGRPGLSALATFLTAVIILVVNEYEGPWRKWPYATITGLPLIVALSIFAFLTPTYLGL